MSNSEVLSLIFTLIAVIAIGALLSFLFYTFIKGQIHNINLGNRDLDVVKSIIDKKDAQYVKKVKRRKTARLAVSYTLLGLFVPLFVFMVIGRATNGVSKFGDTTVLVVSSGSMSSKNASNSYLKEYKLNNQIKTYDIVTFKDVSSSNPIKQFDIVAYTNKDNNIIIHRVIDMVELDGEIRYITRGDANSVSDTYMPRARDILGTYTNKSVPFFGAFILFFQSYTGILTALLIAYILVFISLLYDKYQKVFLSREALLSEKIDFSNATYDDIEINHHNIIMVKDQKYEICEQIKGE